MKYVCIGRVHPERAGVHFSRAEVELGHGGRAVASCDAAQLTVVLYEPNVDGWISGYLLAEEVANTIVGALGFASGAGYSVELIQITEEDGTPHVFGVQPGSGTPEEGLSLTDSQEAFRRALRLSGSDVFFRLAVRDYLRAIRDANDCGHYCYRAIEGIKSAFEFRSGTKGWKPMHDALKTDRATITTKVKHFADPIRHGNWIGAVATTGQDRWEMLKLTREILTRYLGHAEAAA